MGFFSVREGAIGAHIEPRLVQVMEGEREVLTGGCRGAGWPGLRVSGSRYEKHGLTKKN